MPGKSGVKFSFAGKQLVHFVIRQSAHEAQFHRNAGNGEGWVWGAFLLALTGAFN